MSLPGRGTALKKLTDLESDNPAVIVYQDEVHFQVTASVTGKWLQKGSKPKIGSAPGRKSVPYSGYVVPSTGKLFLNKPAWFNYGTVIQSSRDFIANYPIDDSRMIYMVIDNAPWHKRAYRLIQEENWRSMQI